ncbi:hypothetical protein GH714_006279 [Hevea brasiliensis]|uniref:Leucine-rich repeat-containing N-terminal plant-type domain-containing protein n=1 Tax=Hevea brasiliensis TaxID=3981 RepID=A0A6A6M8N9_HEVBR|nr:hypothetical protein GH714_006231 [Hevea brasiliensis]KAF2310042.1 hypothetical protein GH714_006279 [Hevea brasiliensis]
MLETETGSVYLVVAEPSVEITVQMIVSQLMSPKQQIFLPFLFLQVLAIAAQTDAGDFAVLSALMEESWKNMPSSWTSADPCGDKWEGIKCLNSRITYM